MPQTNPFALTFVLVFVAWLAFSIGRIYEKLRQAKLKAGQRAETEPITALSWQK